MGLLRRLSPVCPAKETPTCLKDVLLFLSSLLFPDSSADSVDSDNFVESADSVHSANYVDAADSVDPVYSVDSVDTANSVD